MGLMKLIIMGIDQFGEKNNSTVSYTAVVNDLPAEIAADRRPFPPANEMRPLYSGYGPTQQFGSKWCSLSGYDK